MRVASLVLSAIVALSSFQSIKAQTCPFSSSQCPATQVSVPAPWYNIDFSTDPRLNPSVGIANAAYGWMETIPGDSCAQFHRGLINLPGSTNNSHNLGPHIDLMATSGAYSVGTALPGVIGGTGQGDIAQGTRGWSFEVTVRADAEGARTNWAKFVNIGTSSQQRTGRCHGEWLMGWQGGSDSVSMGTCVDGREDKIENFLTNAPDLQWLHFVSVIQYSATSATYFVYYNGNLAGRRDVSQHLATIVRDKAYLGRASWPDAYFNGTIDAFSIYDVALTAPQVKGLFGEKMNGCTVTRAAYQNMTMPADAVTPIFDAAFTSNITQAPSVPADFHWLPEDPEDVACGVNTQHQGLLSLAGDADWGPSTSSGPYVNLSSTAGENYIGQTIPIFGNVTSGQGTVAARTAGFSIEVSFKASFQNPAAKIFTVGNGVVNGNCQPGDMWAGWRGSEYLMEIKYCDRLNNYRTIVDGNIPILLRTWYHMVITFTAQPDDSALINVFINGQPMVSTQNQAMLPAIYRQTCLLGRSQFFGSSDTYFSGLIDRFAVYNRALSANQVSALAATSGTRSCLPTANTLTSVAANSVFYRATFDSDPRPVGAQYNWLAADSNDTAVDQRVHTGLLVLGCNGCRNQAHWVNLTASSGPNSLSNVAPIGWFGGEGNGNYLTGTKGWTFESVFKIFPTPSTVWDPVSKNLTGSNGQDWAKLFNLGDGNKGNGRDQCENDVIFGFNGGDRWMKFQSCNTVAQEQGLGDANNGHARRTMKINFWYHLAVTMQLTASGAQGSLWLNGELIETKLMRSYPLYASRQDGRIGDSSWANDPFFNGALDSFTIYSQAVNQQQVNAMYAAAMGLATSSSSTGLPRTSSSSSTGATSLPTGATSLPTGSVTSAPTSSPAPVTSSQAPEPVYPLGSVRGTVNVVLPVTVTPANFNQYKTLLEQDIAANLANVTNKTTEALASSVTVTHIGGVSSGASRRLLQTETPVIFVILGTISQVVTDLGVDASQVARQVAAELSQRAAAGQMTANNVAGTVPAQSINVVVVGADSSTGGSDLNSASSVSQSFVLTVLCAIIALMAL